MLAAVKIALCHAQSINSPIVTCVDFDLKTPFPLISQNPRQAEKSQFTTNTILSQWVPINNGANSVEF